MGHDHCVSAGVRQRQRLCPPHHQLKLVRRSAGLCCLPRVGLHSSIWVDADDLVDVLRIKLEVGGSTQACGKVGRDVVASRAGKAEGGVQARGAIEELQCALTA